MNSTTQTQPIDSQDGAATQEPWDAIEDTLADMETQSAGEYRRMVFAIVDGEQVSADEVRKVVGAAAKSVAAFRDDIQRIRDRKQWSEELQEAQDAAHLRTGLRVRCNEIQTQIARKKRDFEQSLTPLRESLIEVQKQIDEASGLRLGISGLMRLLDASADPGIEEQVSALRMQQTEIHQRQNAVRLHGMRGRPGEAALAETKAGLQQVEAEMAELQSQIDELTEQKFDWRNVAF